MTGPVLDNRASRWEITDGDGQSEQFSDASGEGRTTMIVSSTLKVCSWGRAWGDEPPSCPDQPTQINSGRRLARRYSRIGRSPGLVIPPSGRRGRRFKSGHPDQGSCRSGPVSHSGRPALTASPARSGENSGDDLAARAAGAAPSRGISVRLSSRCILPSTRERRSPCWRARLAPGRSWDEAVGADDAGSHDVRDGSVSGRG